jgi:uncharacterized protein YbjQ (UPF0145 family)
MPFFRKREHEWEKIITTTLETIPNKEVAEVLGTVEATARAVFLPQLKGLSGKVMNELKKKAWDMGADAVIGVKIEGGTGHLSAIGTAVKLRSKGY